MVAKSLSQITTESSQVKHGDLLLVSEKQPDGSYVSNKVKFSNMLKNSDSYFSGDLSKWNAAKLRGSSNPARFAFVGDSNVAGQGSGTGANALVNALASSFPKTFSSLAGFQKESFFGDQNSAAIALSSFDPRITLGTGWAVDSGVSNIFGGRFIIGQSGASGKMSFTPNGSFSKFRFWYPTLSDLNEAVGVYVDDVLIDTINQNAAAGFTYKDYIVTTGTHTISFSVGGGAGNGFVAGVEILDGTDKPILLQGGICGAKSADLNTATDAWNYKRALPIINPDFTVIYCTINDANASTANNTYYSNIENLVASIPNSNGCLCIGFPFNATTNIDGTIDDYSKILKNIALDYGWFYLDCRSFLGRSYVKANAQGFAFDANHPNSSGYNAIATNLYELLKSSGL